MPLGWMFIRNSFASDVGQEATCAKPGGLPVSIAADSRKPARPRLQTVRRGGRRPSSVDAMLPGPVQVDVRIGARTSDPVPTRQGVRRWTGCGPQLASSPTGRVFCSAMKAVELKRRLWPVDRRCAGCVRWARPAMATRSRVARAWERGRGN